MPVILASRPNAYAGSPLDRAAHLREDDAWISASRGDPASLFVPVWRAKTLIHGECPQALFLSAAAADAVRVADKPWAFLGRKAGLATFAVDLSEADDPAPLLAASRGRFEDLRALAGQLPAEDAAILAAARALMHWHACNRFCGVCGTPTDPRQSGWMRQCPSCATTHFPRTDPAVIMLVHRAGRVLLGHSQRFPNSQMYSTLAGFVEPGESLEEAVAREVAEEVGIAVRDVAYHSSQPWPFPANIMLGFYAEARSDAITLQADELRDARWFTRDQLADPDAHGFQLPRRDSIARRLIEDWMDQA